MSGYTKRNLKEDVENQAPKFGMPDELEARFGRTELEGETLGLSHMKLEPNFPKMPGEPPRVQPSRKKKTAG